MALKSADSVESISAAKLGPLVGLSERQTCRLLAQYDCPKVSHHGYELWPAVRSLLMHFKDGAESLDEGAKRDKAAIIANTRKQSDIKTKHLEGEMMPTADAIAVIGPISVAIRQRILASSMTDIEKNEVLSHLAGLGKIDWVAFAKKSAGKAK